MYNDLAHFTSWRQIIQQNLRGETNLTNKFQNWRKNRDYIDMYECSKHAYAIRVEWIC